MAHAGAEVSCVSLTSGTGRDDVGRQPVMFSPQLASDEGDGAAREAHLVGLLQRATQAIKDERAHVAALQREVDDLRQSEVAQPLVVQLQQENRKLKSQIVLLRRQLRQRQGDELRKSEQNEKGGAHEHEKTPKRNGLLSVDRCDSGSLRHSRARASLASVTTTTAASGCYSDAQHTKRQSLSLQRHQLLAPGERREEREDSAVSPRVHWGQRSRHQQKEQRQDNSPAAREPPVVRTQRLSNSAREEDAWRATAPHSREGAYSVGMITRLRRAMAPQPTKEQLGEVIHAMVVEVLRDARRRGLNLNLTRQAPCVYVCEYSGAHAKKGRRVISRVVHLSIDSGRLAVKVGAGHENFLEYLERHCSGSIV